MYGATPGWLCTNLSTAANLLPAISIFLDGFGVSGWQLSAKHSDVKLFFLAIQPQHRFFLHRQAVLLSRWEEGLNANGDCLDI